MTDLIISTLILAAWIIGCAAVYLRQRQLEQRRAHRALRRRLMRYQIKASNVTHISHYSRKVS